ncbi:NAD(P)H-dependent glycerol-3-phosphate dehydrogenase [Borrelia sp. BU AG58]|uniref:NAD(P)H-dependent glycerol-3-phosphate dehydrogenase n=1 Tax=Borrelia sp. BU AG58 TaxID=2887345 RepID=UPI001E43B524|nr:NAD(P)H-dependent glycerol-3-phosphate dehydrogenase [Borrelia sp. BU AG58]UER67547.1 NAD(P)H-dependent glycerol-3-phosphate dehydrogenase [Borrelia sp. BU AG58]
MKIAIIGAGAWGTAVARVLADKVQNNVLLWSFEESVKDSINNEHENVKYLKGIRLPDNLVATSDLIDAVSWAEYVFIATPSLYTLGIFKSIKNIITNATPNLAVLTKGFVTIDGKPCPIVEVAESILEGYKHRIVYITGPSHAEEVGLGVVTGLMAASKSKDHASAFINLFSGTSISVFYSDDVLGVQIAAALKNVFAIAFGILDEYRGKNPNLIGDNTESFLFSVSLNDMKNIAFKIGDCDKDTFLFIAGSGDLDVTCRSAFGRNRRFGREIVSKNILNGFAGIDDLINNIHKIGYFPEGLVAAKEVSLLLDHGLSIQGLAGVVYRILNKEASPEAVIEYIRNFKY